MGEALPEPDVLAPSTRRPPGCWLRGVLVALLLLLPCAGTAQRLAFRTFTADDGLAESVVLVLCHARSGHLWLGTPDGISRFDGQQFTNYGVRDGLAGNVVRAILEDRQGTLWVGTDEGLSRWRDGAWLPPLVELGNRKVRCLAEDGNGTLWAGTFDSGLARIEGADVTLLTEADGLPHNKVRALLLDPDGRLWIGTFGGGVAVRDATGELTSYGAGQGLGNLFVRAMVEASGHGLLVGTNAGVFQWTERGFAPFSPAAALADFAVTALAEDSRGQLWIGTRDHGACRLGRGGLSCFRTEHGLASDSINDIVEDREGNLWLASGAGASRLSCDGFLSFTPESGLPAGGAQAFAELDGEILIGVHGGGVVRLVDGRFETITTRDGLPHDKVLCACPDRAGGVWIGTLDGAARLSAAGIETFSVADGLASGTVYDILIDGERTVWMATLDGLTAIRGRAVRTYTTADGLPANRVVDLVEAREGGLWMATEGGLVRYRNGQLTTYTRADGLPEDFVVAVAQRRDGSIWTASSSGLTRFQEGSVATYTTADGLSHNKVTVILEDDAGRLWVGTTRGIHVFDGSTFTPFSVREGLPSGEINPRAAFKDSQGRLWFGTKVGATMFDPASALPSPPPPPVELTKLEVAGEPIALASGLRFAHSQNSLRFEFVGVSLTWPDDLVYEYRLDGLDSRPRTTRARFVELPAVPPGRYTFQVRARHRGGWSPQPATLGLEIVPPYWQRTWFRIVAGVSVLVLGLLAHLGRVQSMRRRARQLETEVERRTSEVRRERLQVKRRNEQLETINTIIQRVNAELELDRLLRSILEGVSSLEQTDRALALVRDRLTGMYEIRASLGWPAVEGRKVVLSEAEIAEGLLSRTRPVSAGILLGSGEGRITPRLPGDLPRTFLVMTVELDDKPAGYLIFGSEKETVVEEYDVEPLANVKEHVTSAFIKGRLMEELRELNDKKDEFLGIAAHDLRSPLGGVKSYVDLLLRFVDEGRFDRQLWRRFLGNVRIATDQMLSLVNDLLDVSAIETGRVTLRLDRQAMAEILEEREALQFGSAEAKRIELRVDRRGADVEVLADRIRIGEVLDNLMSNAVKYTKPGGRIRVYCEVVNGELVTHVEDTGQGIAAGELPHVFSGRKLSPKPTGGEASTGLGLVIAKKLVELHGGKIWVESEEGAGTTFSFSIPRAQ